MPSRFEIIRALDEATTQGQPQSRRTLLEAFAELRRAQASDMIKAIEEATGETSETLLEAFTELRRAQAAGTLTKAARDELVESVLESEAWDIFAASASDIYLPEGSVQETMTASVRLGLREVPLKGHEIDLAPLDRQILRYLERRSAKLVREISASTRAGMRRLLVSSFNKGSHAEASRLILDRKDFGLTEHQTKHFQNWVEQLQKDSLNPRAKRFGTSKKLQNRLVDREFKRRLKNRADLIARTEHSTAGNVTRRELWASSAEQGELDDLKYILEWVTRAIGFCPRCGALSGKLAEIRGGIFVSDLGEKVTSPTVHPGCYCATRIVRRGDLKAGT